MKCFDIAFYYREKAGVAKSALRKKLQVFLNAYDYIHYIRSKKKISPVVFTLSACLFLLSFIGTFSYFNSFFYTVYLGDEKIGLVGDKNDVEVFISDLAGEKTLEYETEVFASGGVSFSEKIFYFRGEDNLEEVRKSISDNLTFYAWSYLVYINEQPVVYLKDKQVLDEIIELLKQRFVPERPDIRIISVEPAENIDGKTVKVAPGDIKSMEEAISLLSPHTQSRRVYLASRGDTLGDIALSHDMEVEDLQKINPDLNNERLDAGQEVNITGLPKITIVSVEEHKAKESIAFNTKYVNNNQISAGKTRVKNEGKNGTKEITYRITRENGLETNKKVVKETVLENPVDRVIERGTRQESAATASGTGRFIWPVPRAYDGGGRITRHFGGGHTGIDIYASTLTNTPIIAADSGTVIVAHNQRSYGNLIVINHGRYYTAYAHCSRLLVSSGQSVSRGSTIAYMGNTGTTYGRTGIHLHFEIRTNNNSNWQRATPVNPLNFFR